MPIADVEKIVRHEPLDSCYEIGRELGRGKFAIVKRCTEKKTGTQYAAKILKKRRRGKSVREDILMEVDIMRQGMDHHQIIKLYEVFETQTEFYIIIELALGGELFRVIAVDPLPEEKARGVVFQILEGVRHLHTLNIVHMDLKPENLLLYQKGSLEIKIVDFGLAVQLQEGQEMKSLVGTAEYVSPEILSFEALSTYSDMWSIGALTYALLAGYSPFQGETHQETFLNVSTCDYDFEDEVFDVVSADAKDFIEKLLIRAPNKRLTAEVCLKHPWIKAHAQQSTTPNTGNLDGSMSSLDSALCMDSASSMEPSPVSSASSSFSPAPSATSRSGTTGTVTSTTTTTTTCAASTSTAVAPPPSELSQPEDMKKVNEKLGQISKLATEQIIAETAEKPRPEGSPTSTASSTSTLRGEESNEPAPVTNPEISAPREVTDGRPTESVASSKPSLTTPANPTSSGVKTEPHQQQRTVSFERSQRERERPPQQETPSFKSSTLGRERTPPKKDDDRRTVSFERKYRSPYLDTTTSTVTTSTSSMLGRGREGEREERRTVSFEKRDTRSPQDIATLDPKTVESIERFQRLKERSKARESESYIQPLSVLKERSPEPGQRRRSDGEHTTTATQRRLNSKPRDAPTSISEEDKSPRSSVSPENANSSRKTTSPAPEDSRKLSPPRKTSTSAALTPPATRKSLSPDLRRRCDRDERSISPGHQHSAKIDPADRTQVCETGKRESPPQEKEPEKTVVVGMKEQTGEKAKNGEETETEGLESARKERERAREERRRARKEEENKKEQERKKLREETEKKMEEERKRMEQEREKSRDVRRRERERKLAQRNNSSGSGSSESLVKPFDRNKWAWSVEARTTEPTAHLNGVKPHPQGSESNEKEEREEVISKSPVQQPNRAPPAKKTERKTSASEYFQFGLDYSAPRNSVKQQKQPEPVHSSSSSQQQTPAGKVEDGVEKRVSGEERSDSPVVIVSAPPTPETRENHEAAPIRHDRRELSPATEHKRLKANRRRTPVISTDALDAILRGDVEDDASLLRYATEPNPYYPSQLESCPEVDEPQITPSRAKSPSPLLKVSERDANGHFLAERREGVLPSALRDPNRAISPEKRRVTLLTEKDRTQSVDLDRTLSPEYSDRSTPSPSPDNISKSFDAGRSHRISKPAGVSRLTVSGSYSALSRSTPDLSDIVGGAGKKGKDGRKVERSSSRRFNKRSRVDTYVTSTEHSSSYYQSPASPLMMKSSRHATVTSRLLSGGKGFLSKLSESNRQNHKLSS